MRPVHRWLLWGSSIVTAVTGVAYWWMEHMIEPTDTWAVINHPLQPWALKAHIVVAPALVFALGLITTDHVARHLRAKVRAGRRSGLLALAVFAPMTLSGYLIQAVTHTGWLTALVTVHVGAGVVYVGALAVHRWGLAERRSDSTHPY